MARAVICFGLVAIGLCCASPASAQPLHKSGYIAVSRMQIDPRMTMMNDAQAPQPQGLPRDGAAEHGQGIPLDQLGDSGDPEGPAGDDPFADNAVETDVVYSI